MQLGDRLRNIRENKDLKQTEVARDTGINNKVLSSYERNISLPTIDNLVLLCNYYQVSADVVLGLQPKQANPAEKSLPTMMPSSILSEEQKRILYYYDRLSEENKDAIKGMMVTYYKEQEKK